MLNTIINRAPIGPQENLYPRLMQGKQTGMVVLFFAEKEGLILEGQDTSKECRAHQRPGYVGRKWIMEGFKPFDGSATLNNA